MGILYHNNKKINYYNYFKDDHNNKKINYYNYFKDDHNNKKTNYYDHYIYCPAPTSYRRP